MVEIDYKNIIACEVRIENSVTRVTDRHHEACRTVIQSDGIFNSYRATTLDTFPSTTVCKLGFVLFYQFNAEINTFPIKKC